MTRRVDIKAILADSVQRRRLMIPWLIATQAREGREITRERAEEVYDKIQAEKAIRKDPEPPEGDLRAP